MISTPYIVLSIRTPLRIRAYPTGLENDSTLTGVQWQLSDVSDFSTLALDAVDEVPYGELEYMFGTGEEDSLFYIRARSVGTDDEDPELVIYSDWSNELTTSPSVAPTPPVLEQVVGTPQRIGVRTEIPDMGVSDVVFEFSTSTDFVDDPYRIETTSSYAEYAVPETLRDTIHYVRAKFRRIEDFLSSGDEVTVDSDWSESLVVFTAGKIGSIDISSLSAEKITSGVLSANLVIGGRIVAGADPALESGGYVEMKGTGIEWVPQGSTNPSVVIPSTGDAVFSGVSINANKGFEGNNTTLRGTGNIADNSVMTLSQGTITDPVTSPVVAAIWPTQMTVAAGPWSGVSYDSAASKFWFARTDGARGYDGTTGTLTDTLSFSSLWTSISNSSGYSWQDMTYSSSLGKFVQAGTYNSGVTGTYDVAVVRSSTTGTSWTSATQVASATLYGYRFNGIERSESDSLFVACGYRSFGGALGLIYTSTDGTTWTSRTSNSTGSLTSVARSDTQDRWVVVGQNGTVPCIRTSSDGITWATQTAPHTATGYYRAVAVNNTLGFWVTVGDGGAIATSTDGLTWTSRTSNTTSQLLGVGCSPTMAVAVGSGGRIVTSTDGINWTVRSSGISSYSIMSVAWSQDEQLWVAVSLTNQVTTSPDGINWTARATGGATNINDVYRSEVKDLWLGSGSNATIYSSTGGVTVSSVTGAAVGPGDGGVSRIFAIGAGSLGRFNKSTGALSQLATVSTYSSRASRATVFYDNSKIKVVTQDVSGTGGRVQLVAYDPTDLTLTPTIETLDVSFTGNFSFYGATRFVIGGVNYYGIALTDVSGRSGIYAFNISTGAREAQFDFFDSQGNVPDGGLAYDGTRFYSLPTADSVTLQKHSTFHPGDATQNTYVRYALANSTNTTRVSPAANIALMARAYLSIVLPELPATVTKARVYVRGAAVDNTGANSYLKISTGLEDALTYSYGDVDYRTGFDTNVGSLGPWATASGAAAVMKSAFAGWELSGTGLITFSERTNPPLPSADKAVLFLKDNGSGKSQLCIQFATGTPIVIATQV